MKYPVTRFKSMDVALKEIEPFVKDAAHLQSRKPFTKFGGMRSREIVANWLLCATIQAVDKRELLFYSDPIGGDGILQAAATGHRTRLAEAAPLRRCLGCRSPTAARWRLHLRRHSA